MEWTDREQDIIDNIDRAITELVYEKAQIIKAYNYYHAKRDPEQFRHLEENFGIGTPTSIEFIPLTRKHIDVLIGEYLSTNLLPRISCKDSKTLSSIQDEKKEELNSKLGNILKNYLNKKINQEDVSVKDLEQNLTATQEIFDRTFISNYEIAGQNIVDWSMQSRVIDFLNKRKILLTDLLITGTGYYKVCPSPNKTNVTLRILNPINTFIDRNPNSPYLKDSARSVIREYMTKDQILTKYGEFLNKEDLDILDNLNDTSMGDGSSVYIRSYDTSAGYAESSPGILGGLEVAPLLPFERTTSKHYRLFPVYEVEWLKTEKENGKFVTNRYEGVRIGSIIHIPIGKSENIIRSIDDDVNCTLSVNGIFYSDRNGEPYSLILKTANLQDKNDVLYFYRDNIIAESGTAGDWLDLAYLPKFLGSDVSERLMKWKAYKKAGTALIDSSQEGMPPMNTTFGGFDDTVKLQAIQAIDLAIQRNEEECSGITGVFRERLGGIEQKDAVTNVAVGVKQSSLITKQYYQVMDLMTREILIDILNTAKITYKKGLTGTLILGDKLNKIFTALPKHYSFTDYDIHIADSAEIIKEQETIKQLSMELTKGGMIDAEVLIEMVTAKGLTTMKEDVKMALEKKRKENNQLGQLDQQVKQLDQQLKQTTSEAQKLQQQIQQLNAEKTQLEKDRFEFEKQIEWFKAKDISAYNEQKLEWEKKRVELEGLQLLDDNKRNDEIKNE